MSVCRTLCKSKVEGGSTTKVRQVASLLGMRPLRVRASALRFDPDV